MFDCWSCFLLLIQLGSYGWRKLWELWRRHCRSRSSDYRNCERNSRSTSNQLCLLPQRNLPVISSGVSATIVVIAAFHLVILFVCPAALPTGPCVLIVPRHPVLLTVTVLSPDTIIRATDVPFRRGWVLAVYSSRWDCAFVFLEDICRIYDCFFLFASRIDMTEILLYATWQECMWLKSSPVELISLTRWLPHRFVQSPYFCCFDPCVVNW